MILHFNQSILKKNKKQKHFSLDHVKSALMRLNSPVFDQFVLEVVEDEHSLDKAS